MYATSAEKGAEGKKSEKGILYVWVGSQRHRYNYTNKMMSLYHNDFIVTSVASLHIH